MLLKFVPVVSRDWRVLLGFTEQETQHGESLHIYLIFLPPLATLLSQALPFENCFIRLESSSIPSKRTDHPMKTPTERPWTYPEAWQSSWFLELNWQWASKRTQGADSSSWYCQLFTVVLGHKNESIFGSMLWDFVLG